MSELADFPGGSTWCAITHPVSKIYHTQAWLDRLGQSWVTLVSKDATSPCWCSWLDWKRTLSPGKLWRWLCPLLWDQKVSLWLSPSPSRRWLSCHHPQTQSPGLAHLAPDCHAPAATADSTAAGPEPRNETRMIKAALLSGNGVKKLKL